MGPWFSAEGLEKVARLKEIAEKAGLTLTEMALGWCLHRPEVTSAIIGASKIEHVEEAAAAADVELSDDVVAAINRVAQA